MRFREPTLTLSDIVEAIDAIMQFTRGIDAAAFRSDPKTVAAVERKLQVISEAAIRLGDQAEILCSGLPWRNLRGIGTWLRHQYDRIDVAAIWLTVTDDLPPLWTSAFFIRRARLVPAGNQIDQRCSGLGNPGSERFNVNAEAERCSTTTEQQLLTMLRNLLIERFQLHYLRENLDEPVCLSEIRIPLME